MSDIYSVTILSAMSHTRETKRILEPYARARKQSEYIRKSVLDFAIRKGFKPVLTFTSNEGFKPTPTPSIKKPEYITIKNWQRIINAHEKSHYVDYNYAIAFFWLKALPEYEGYNKSKLMRKIIIKSSNCRCHQ